MIAYIDSHAHLTGDDLYPEAEAMIERARAAGVEAIVNISTTTVELERGLELSKRYPWLYHAAATHPHDAERDGGASFDALAHYARQGALKAIGEIGLDYYYTHAPKEAQQRVLRRYLQLALECRLPVVIHCREAFADFFDILDSEYRIDQRYGPGVLHCFTGTEADAEEVLKRGWYISMSGIVTFKKSVALHAVAKKIPLERLLIETDAPFLAPQNRRGKRNEPAYVVETAAFLAALKGISVDALAKHTSGNATELFRL